jgi:hypothetical protein
MQPASISGWKTRLQNLDWMDWIVILIVLAGICVAVYTTSLRHP